MQSIRRLGDLRTALAGMREQGGLVALVPTMGALHAGHMALIAEARARAMHVVASIFVNPLQFAPAEDLSTYPRREAGDRAMLAEAGCDLLWCPDAAEMYPDGFATTVSVAGVSEAWDGAARPGHFDGVATVVAKLFGQVRPDIALFGEKDFQQLAVIRRLVADLDMGVEIVGVPTVRDDDGLALSSRNAYLDDDERQRALALPRALGAARDAVERGEDVDAAIVQARGALRAGGFDPIDYVALVDAGTLGEAVPGRPRRLIAAATLGRTRLIDNLEVAAAAPQQG